MPLLFCQPQATKYFELATTNQNSFHSENYRQKEMNTMVLVAGVISAFQVLSSFILIMVDIRGNECLYDSTMALSFIGLNYAMFAIM